MEPDSQVELNNYLQGHPSGNLTPFFTYTMSQSGNDLQPTHHTTARFAGNIVGEGRGKTKGASKRAAAMNALQHFKVHGIPDHE
ncbi:hypothetical protein BC826DRAFT_1011968 [Russula brevipes]|nr:hypothetical protein BC826DRAFT_1011968 [Russula brevipes]